MFVTTLRRTPWSHPNSPPFNLWRWNQENRHKLTGLQCTSPLPVALNDAISSASSLVNIKYMSVARWRAQEAISPLSLTYQLDWIREDPDSQHRSPFWGSDGTEVTRVLVVTLLDLSSLHLTFYIFLRSLTPDPWCHFSPTGLTENPLKPAALFVSNSSLVPTFLFKFSILPTYQEKFLLLYVLPPEQNFNSGDTQGLGRTRL